MPKRHFQTTRIFAAEDALPGRPMPWPAALALLDRVCTDHDIPVPPLEAAERLRVSAEGVELPKRPRPTAVLHAAAHLLTDPTFPPHGSEFAGRWLDLVRRYAARTSPLLGAEFSARKIHHTAPERAEKVRRGAVYLANNRPGIPVELVLDDPPERVTGSIEAVEDGAVRVGGREFPLGRCRYIYKVPA